MSHRQPRRIVWAKCGRIIRHALHLTITYVINGLLANNPGRTAYSASAPCTASHSGTGGSGFNNGVG